MISLFDRIFPRYFVRVNDETVYEGRSKQKAEATFGIECMITALTRNAGERVYTISLSKNNPIKPVFLRVKRIHPLYSLYRLG